MASASKVPRTADRILIRQVSAWGGNGSKVSLRVQLWFDESKVFALASKALKRGGKPSVGGGAIILMVEETP